MGAAIKKIHFDKNCLKAAVYVFAVAASVIAFEKILANPKNITDFVSGALGAAMRVLMPFAYGFAIAYFMNPGVRRAESLLSRVKPLRSRPKALRALSALSIFAACITAVVWITAFLAPQAALSVTGLINSVHSYLLSLNGLRRDGMLQDFLDSVNAVFSTHFTLYSVLEFVFEPLIRALSAVPSFADRVFTQTVSIAGALLNLLLGFMIAFYMLCEKENAAASLKKALCAFFRPAFAEGIFAFARKSNTVFEKFVIGKMLDSAIIGLMFFAIAAAMRLPYPLLLSLIIGVANMVPLFGPFIGGAFAALIVSLNDPLFGLWAALGAFLLQQFDGIVLGPKILGDSTGLKPMGVIFAILAGGALFGIAGMFFGVPIFAVLSQSAKAFIDGQNEKKGRGRLLHAESAAAGREPDPASGPGANAEKSAPPAESEEEKGKEQSGPERG
jgi:predicted PurR-regulated permease PerM